MQTGALLISLFSHYAVTVKLLDLMFIGGCALEGKQEDSWLTTAAGNSTLGQATTRWQLLPVVAEGLIAPNQHSVLSHESFKGA